MARDQTQYEIFLSYARKDNRPISDTFSHGWVTALRDQIFADHRRFSTEPLRIFFDTDEIRDMDDWRHRILGALRSSKILLVCLSPAYFASPPCRWEWDEYLQRQVHQLLGSESVATVYFVEVPGSAEHDNARRLGELLRGNFTDLRPWFPAGAAALEDEEVRKRMARLGQSLWERIQRARRAERAPGNLRRQNPHFVGRRHELRRLHENLGVGAVGVVTVVHGLGGQGKTELAVAYAHGFADCYPAGLWMLAAEGKRELLPLIGELAFAPELGYTPSEAEKADAALLGRGVLAALQRRAQALREADPDGGAAALVILDNVSEPGLLSKAQLATLPQADWLRLVATTRLGQDQIPALPKTLGHVEVSSLDEESALALLRDHQPPRDRQGNIAANSQEGVPRFASAAEEAAARELVGELGCFTLAVEQAAVYLGLYPEILPSQFLAGMRRKGLASGDALPVRDADVAGQMLHREKQLGAILEATLAPLPSAARTALKFAALLPPDTVPWPWLRELTVAQHPELEQHAADEPDPWGTIRRRLEGLRLLTAGDRPEIARVHRLVAAHLQPEGNGPLAGALWEYVTRSTNRVKDMQSPPAAWELDALLGVLPALLAVEPPTTAIGHDLARATMFVSGKFKICSGLSAAVSLLSAAHGILIRLAASDPGNVEWQRDLSVVLGELGDVAVALGNLTEAQRRFGESLDIFQRMWASDPGNAWWQRGLSILLGKVGNVAVALGNLTEAQRRFTESLDIDQRLAAADPGNAARQRDLSLSLGELGDVEVALGDLTAAGRRFAESLDIAQRLAAADPGNAAWQRNLSLALDRLGDVAVALGNLTEAQRRFAESLDIRRRLLAADPGNAARQRDLSVSLGKLGNVAVAQGNLTEAQRRFAEWLDIAQHLAESDPENAEWQRDLSVSLDRLGDVAVALGNLPAAQRRFAESLDIFQRLSASDPGNAAWQRDLSVSLNRLGNVAVALGNLPEAQRRFAESLDIARHLAANDPENTGWQQDLSVPLGELGEVAVALGNLPEAQRRFAESLDIAQRLAATDPGNAGWQRGLWVSYWRIGDLLERQGQPAANDYLRRAYDTLAALEQAGVFLSAQDREFLESLRTKLSL